MLLAAAAVLNQINIQRIHIYLCSNRYVMLCAVRVLCVECTSAVHSASSKCMNGLLSQQKMAIFGLAEKKDAHSSCIAILIGLKFPWQDQRCI